MNHYSYSRVMLFKQCPYKYFVRYILKIKEEENFEATNALWLGTALHLGIDEGVKEAEKNYFSNYYVIDDNHVNEAIKLSAIIPKCQELLALDKEHIFELKVEHEGFLGFIDLLIKNDDGTYDMYDFKYSNNHQNYLNSYQLHVYKYFLEKATNMKVKNMYFLFAPKTFIRQKRDETLQQFRIRLADELSHMQATLAKVDYDEEKVVDFLQIKDKMLSTIDFEPKENEFCKWCDLKGECKNATTKKREATD